MNSLAALILGLLIGWLGEWVIDWIYWRRKQADPQVGEDESSRIRIAEMEQELASYRHQLAILQTERSRMDEPIRPRPAAAREEKRQEAVKPSREFDPLDEIQGLNPVMVQRLYESGITTYRDLGSLHPRKLKEILGQLLDPGSEVEIIRKARLKAGLIKKVDDLEIIVGIGPVIARALNVAGIYTFTELAALSAADLREIVGEKIERLADEEQILSQARQLSEESDRGE
jgi:predicted flap endonuclease-1-like 5' DNA nuclease